MGSGDGHRIVSSQAVGKDFNACFRGIHGGQRCICGTSIPVNSFTRDTEYRPRFRFHHQGYGGIILRHSPFHCGMVAGLLYTQKRCRPVFRSTKNNNVSGSSGGHSSTGVCPRATTVAKANHPHDRRLVLSGHCYFERPMVFCWTIQEDAVSFFWNDYARSSCIDLLRGFHFGSSRRRDWLVEKPDLGVLARVRDPAVWLSECGRKPSTSRSWRKAGEIHGIFSAEFSTETAGADGELFGDDYGCRIGGRDGHLGRCSLVFLDMPAPILQIRSPRSSIDP